MVFRERTHQNETFFWYEPAIFIGDNDTISGSDICSFLSEEMQVRPRQTTLFTRNATTHDELLLAILSLLLLLVIQGIVTTLLLRTRKGRVDTLSFSVTQVVELARDFAPRRIFRTRHEGWERTERRRSGGVNRTVVVMALVIMLVTFGVEVTILLITTPRRTSVDSRRVSLQLEHPWNPRWEQVRFHYRASINRPCMAVSLVGDGVEQGGTSVSSCVTADLSARAELFERATEMVEVRIVSDVHEFGAEHFVRVGNVEGRFSARAFFRLSRGRVRVMRQREKFYLKMGRVSVLHRQYVALLFNAYRREIEDGDMGVDRLNGLNFSTVVDTTGPQVEILRRGNGTKGYYSEFSTRYVTRVKGVIPGGDAAVRFAHSVFKDGIAIRARDVWHGRDLFVGGVEEVVVEDVWRERGRVVNVVSLGLALLGAVVVLVGLRGLLRPCHTAEIAELAVGAGFGGRVEDENRGYRFGAEIGQIVEEYYE